MHPIRPLLVLAITVLGCVTASAQVRDFGAADGNNDGRISSSEHEDYADAFFNRIDRDQNGNITSAEIDAAAGIIAGQAPGQAQVNAAYKIRQHDTNGDGQISKTEFAAAAVARFRWMDVNSNGELSPQEFAAGG